MPVYLVNVTASSSRSDRGDHTVTFAVRGFSPEDVRARVLACSVGWLPPTDIYNLRGALGPGAVVLDEFHINFVRKARARVRLHTWCTLEICVDCMLVAANGECDPYRSGDLPEPLCEVAGEDVVLGVDSHCDDCLEVTRENGECDCDQLGFCQSQCQGCGDWHHGDRFAAVILRERVGKLWVERT
jgi:hypothetical protein